MLQEVTEDKYQPLPSAP